MKSRWCPTSSVSTLVVLMTLALPLLGGVLPSMAQPHDPNLVWRVAETSLQDYAQSPPVSGRLTVAGSDTMQTMMVKLAAGFSGFYPDTAIAVEGGGSSEAIREFMFGIAEQRRGDKGRKFGHEGASKAAMLASSRPLTADERKRFASRHGDDPLEIPIAMDAVAVYVHAENPLQGLTLDQVRAIFTGAVTTWGQLGMQEGWKKQPIRAYGRDNRSGTREYFTETVLKGESFRTDVQEFGGSAMEVLAIARDPVGIGYLGMGFQSSMTRVVPIARQEGEPFVVPDPETVSKGTYPLSRALYLYVNQDPQEKFNPLIR
ncbi:MAG: PstS family phosphate ABC transporter substrate-binding protein, partial [Nitrospira sp.]|nr:PstS family phosphate ABC transporter substrate-binding protein [Nitrospira sp.]